MNPQGKSLLHRAVKIMGELGALCGEEFEQESDQVASSKCVNCHLNDVDFLLETDLWYENDTTIGFNFELIPNQKIEVDSQLDKKLDLIMEHIRNLSKTPVEIERDYGNTPDETTGYFPDCPDRKNVGTLLMVTFVIGNERHEEEDKKLRIFKSEEKAAYDRSSLELTTTINDAVNFAAVVLEEIEKSKLL